ncbi:MogA/MoaB family molybdenum cofactor biosynthesis protein [Corynebacterium endometrii]|uniref:Molybdenum cofactor biosynthesis protein B n=1 Tax=Corynebacterium endometrii TaxID=2488819 RepID=A0A4P7QF14_9CORY|nr:MogA/MoaB family molybdenum cofactor biosynthesis protein [Corynebacterium endometrii]QCB27970.1 Molybdenum cofactor biosynthesis protein B [Corynebacterium endometrii]
MARALVVVASTRAARGEYRDRSGALLVDWLRDQGFEVGEPLIVADSDMPSAMQTLFAGDPPRVVLTTGGTGITSDDHTVAAVRPYLDKELPGIMTEFFRRGVEKVPTAILSGGVAGIAGRTFVMTLPGSTGGVKDGIAVLEPVLDHIVALLEGTPGH